uniref:Large ribosomal subunit protein bL21c n=1 Tax=Platysiphonia delicata TaxID=2006979 RepID=A0A1Z1M0C9_9FLOR|nr:ribosomal protein L21 [Platysiphonia delicata]ARW59508.1 ribosomal protein L21 [Platysiphonia delicata]
MNYAIVDASGRQILMQVGRFYDINYIPGEPGDKIYLNRVLFLSCDNVVKIGRPCVTSSVVKTKILRHLKSKKLTVFKMKPKKNYRVKNGFKQKLTRVFVESIF